MWTRAALLPLLLVTACKAQQAKEASPFPDPQRPVAPIVSPRYSNEDARDSIGEFETVIRLAEIRPGMSVADIGAGEGYYTVRVSPIVGRNGRVLAEDIVGHPLPGSVKGGGNLATLREQIRAAQTA